MQACERSFVLRREYNYCYIESRGIIDNPLIMLLLLLETLAFGPLSSNRKQVHPKPMYLLQWNRSNIEHTQRLSQTR